MNIYVSNLHFNVEDKDLKEFFSPFGEVLSVKVIKDKESNRSRGFGFVEMPNDTDGANAIKNLDGAMVAGRSISVVVARPKDKPDPFKNNTDKNKWV